jgi:surface carbohydrate biosynthesis protein (TIGR04326 family)
MLPYVLQAIVSLRHLFSRWQLRNQYIPKWFGGPSSILMCSYFFNLNAKGDGNCFHSNQWGRLSSHLKDLGYKLNWIQHYLPSTDIPNVHVAASRLEGYNQGANHEIHSFLDGYLSLPLIFKVISSWIANNILRWGRLDVSKNFQVEDSHVWLWPLLKHDWMSSVSGVDSIMNWFWVELFDSALKDFPEQSLGMYLWENQAWETALLKAWRKYQHGHIIGVPHATICFWHLNNFEDNRCLVKVGNFPKLQPDYLAVNGKMAWRQFVEAGYPLSKMKEVEAMRFEYLGQQNENAPTKYYSSTFLTNVEKRILLLGDFTLSRTLKMLDCIRGLYALSGRKIDLTIKPHPVSNVSQTHYPYIHFKVTNEPIKSLVGQFDMVLASNTTSAALDVLLSGLPVAVYMDGADFNHSPLKNILNTSFVTNSQELNSFLYTESAQNKTPSPDDFFWFDKNLERWTNLISKAKN